MTRVCILILLAPVLLVGCLSAGEVTLNQQFMLAPKTTPATAAPTARTLGVRPLNSARVYSMAMLYTDSDGALMPYPTAVWAESPAVMFTRALTDALVQTGRFADVGNAAEMARPDFSLTGELRKFHEDRSGGAPAAVVELRLELRQSLGVQQVWAQTLSARAPLAGTRPADLAAAMDQAAAEVCTKAADAIAAAPLPEAPAKK